MVVPSPWLTVLKIKVPFFGSGWNRVVILLARSTKMLGDLTFLGEKKCHGLCRRCDWRERLRQLIIKIRIAEGLQKKLRHEHTVTLQRHLQEMWTALLLTQRCISDKTECIAEKTVQLSLC